MSDNLPPALRLDPTPLTEASVEDYIRASAEAHGQDADAAVWAWRQQAAAAANEPGVTTDPRDAENARLRAEVESWKRRCHAAWESGDVATHRALVAEAERDRARDLAANLEAECARLSETVARVEALRDRWRDLADEIRFTDLRDDMSTTGAARALDAALTGPTETVG